MLNITKKTLSNMAVFSILSAIVVVSITSNQNAFAMHDTWYSWSEADQEYVCKSNLTSLDTTSNVSVCGDLYPSAQRWNNVANSDWNLALTTGSGIDVGSSNLGETGPLAQTWTVGIFTIVTAWIDVNTEYTLGDWQHDSGDIYDYQSIMTHEFGHLLKLDHNTSTSSTMYESIPSDTNRRSLNSHDTSTVAGKY